MVQVGPGLPSPWHGGFLLLRAPLYFTKRCNGSRSLGLTKHSENEIIVPSDQGKSKKVE